MRNCPYQCIIGEGFRIFCKRQQNVQNYKRLLIFFVAAFIFLSVSIYLILNEPFIQNRIIKYINAHYLAQDGISLSIAGMSYNLISQNLTIDAKFDAKIVPAFFLVLIMSVKDSSHVCNAVYVHGLIFLVKILTDFCFYFIWKGL